MRIGKNELKPSFTIKLSSLLPPLTKGDGGGFLGKLTASNPHPSHSHARAWERGKRGKRGKRAVTPERGNEKNEAAALWHAQERSRLMKQGKTPAFVDGQIASIAVVYNLVLVTHNVKDFQDLAGLAIEDWQE